MGKSTIITYYNIPSSIMTLVQSDLRIHQLTHTGHHTRSGSLTDRWNMLAWNYLSTASYHDTIDIK